MKFIFKMRLRAFENNKLTSCKLEMACIELVTINGKPLGLMNAGGFRKIVDPILRAVPKDDKITINVENTRKLVLEEANEIRQRIKEEVKVSICLLY